MSEQLYRAAEQKLWALAGVQPKEQQIRLAVSGVQIRVQEVGGGAPVLFLHGGPNAGSTWALLAARLLDYRCLIVDRPGTGLSEPYPLDVSTVESFADRFVAEVLDGLGIERADLVASSFGGYVALRSAAAHPDRVGRMVQMGCPPFVAGGTVPGAMRLMMAPGFRHLICALPPSDRAARMSLRQIGHGRSLDANRIPQDFHDWYLALQRYTDTMRNETALIAATGTFRRGFDPSLTLDSRLLRSIHAPTHFLWGQDEPFGDAEVAQRLVAALPNAELDILPDAGHLPWLDDPDHAALLVRRSFGSHSIAHQPRRVRSFVE